MNKATLTVKLNVDDLRQGAALFNNMADMLANGTSSAVINNDDVDKNVIDVLFIDGDNIEVFVDSQLTLPQHDMLTETAKALFKGRVVAAPAADAFGGDDDKALEAGPTASEKTNDIELDEDNLPWDARINTDSKLKLARGNTWKVKRNLDPAFVETVKAELRAVMSAPAATTAAPDNVTNIADAKPAAPAGPSGPGPAKPSGPESPAIEVKYVTDDGEWTRGQLKGALFTDEQIDALPIAATATEVTTETTFPELMQLVTPALANNTITNKQVTAACKKHGVESLNLIAARPDLIPAVKTELFG